MMFLDLFPVGLYQTWVAFTDGTWYARSSAIVDGSGVFVLDLLPHNRWGRVHLGWFVAPDVVRSYRGARSFAVKEEEVEQGEWTVYENDWAEQKDPALGG